MPEFGAILINADDVPYPLLGVFPDAEAAKQAAFAAVRDLWKHRKSFPPPFCPDLVRIYISTDRHSYNEVVLYQEINLDTMPELFPED